MNLKFLLLLSLVGSLTACSSAYKTGQTPDDVYYSPTREQDSYVEAEERRDRYQAQRYDDYVNDYRNDRFLRMSLRNRLYMPAYDDFFWNDWRFGFVNNWYNPWNSYYAWNSFYNPYCVAPVYNGKTYNRYQGVFRPSANAITYYSAPTAPRTTPRYAFTRSSYSNSYLTPSSRSNSSSFRKIMSGIENSSSSGSATRSDRTISPSSSGSSSRSSSGSSSSGGSVSRPGRN